MPVDCINCIINRGNFRKSLFLSLFLSISLSICLCLCLSVRRCLSLSCLPLSVAVSPRLELSRNSIDYKQVCNRARDFRLWVRYHQNFGIHFFPYRLLKYLIINIVINCAYVNLYYNIIKYI